MSSPRRGEVWWADLEPTRGQEINKKRPVVVLSSDNVGVLAIKLVAPITSRPASRSPHPWLVELRKTTSNGLKTDGCADALQLRGISLDRFGQRMGVLSADDLDEVVAAVALVIDFDFEGR